VGTDNLELFVRVFSVRRLEQFISWK